MSRAAQVVRRAAVSAVMDKIASTTETALGGIQRNLETLNKSAVEIAQAGAEGREPTELADPLVRALVAERAVEASAAVLKRANDAMDDVLQALRS